MKTLIEKRNALLDEMDAIVNKAQQETRAFSEEENSRFDAIKAEVAGIDKTLKAAEESRSFEKIVVKKDEQRSAEENRALEIEKEERAFVEFVREGVQLTFHKEQTGL
jgi:HK97 family phage major capsid protein